MPLPAIDMCANIAVGEVDNSAHLTMRTMLRFSSEPETTFTTDRITTTKSTTSTGDDR